MIPLVMKSYQEASKNSLLSSALVTIMNLLGHLIKTEKPGC